jgi:trehalose-6-phosphate synthase
LRPLGLSNLIGYFHHIPWPAPEVLGTLPGSTDLLRAIMDFNLVGGKLSEMPTTLGERLRRNWAPLRKGRMC